MNWMLLHPSEVADDWTFQVRDRRAAHIAGILKSDPGDELRAIVLNEARYKVRVDGVGPDLVTGALLEQLPTPERPATELLLALPRPKVMKRLFSQIVALGVRQIYLCKARKVEKSFFQSPVLELDSIREQLICGLEQVGDPWMPDVAIFPQFRSLIETHLNKLTEASERVVLHPGAGAWAPPRQSRLIAVGPEGGWIPHELELLQANGFRCMQLGSRVLRTDTAVISALSREGLV